MAVADQDPASDRKAYTAGTHRTLPPEETLRRVTPHLSAMGITRIANVTGLDRIGVPVVTVMRPNSRSLSVSQGKGVDLAAAKASGVMEAIESYHAERISLPLRYASYRDLMSAGPHAVGVADPASLPQPKDGRYTDDLPLLWIESEELGSGARVYVPYELIHTDYTLPMPPGSGCFVASTNGLASGNHLHEATAHALAELIERDANTLWNQLPDAARIATRIDLETVDDPACRQVLDALAAADMQVGAWSMTSDVGVASFFCLVADQHLAVAHSGAGAGTHPQRDIALLRALTEAVQVRTNYITGARDDLEAEEYSETGIRAKLDWARPMLDVWPQEPLPVSSVPSQMFETLGEDIRWMAERLHAAGVPQILRVDLTQPQLGIAVVRVVVPGLEGPDDHDEY
ncbi:MAG: YcaO-like family protein, partial [Pseudomonadota bacterium]